MKFDSSFCDKDETFEFNFIFRAQELVWWDSDKRCSGQEVDTQTLVA
jgi:hypothetical protein